MVIIKDKCYGDTGGEWKEYEYTQDFSKGDWLIG